jgi:citrate synthase
VAIWPVESSICFTDGHAGRLAYRGYSIDQLAASSSFEEVAYLLWQGELPTASQLGDFCIQLRSNRALPARFLDEMRAWPRTAEPMDVLRTATSMLGLWKDSDASVSRDGHIRVGTRLLARLPTVVAAYSRLRQNMDPLDPDPELGEAANFLWMLTGERPSKSDVQAADLTLVLHADHGINASTLACRATASTMADLYSAVTSGIGALAGGPRYAGSSAAILTALLQIEEGGGMKPEALRQWVRDTRDKQHGAFIGFGHPIYEAVDPRTPWLRNQSERLAVTRHKRHWFEAFRTIEVEVTKVTGLSANADFYSACLHYLLGLAPDQFTCIFAMGRTAGWIAHAAEEVGYDRLLRAPSKYIGPTGRQFVPLTQR